MCLSELVRLVEVSADGSRATGESPAGPTEVSLAVLALDGVAVRPGDWVIAATGLAVERVSEADAAAITSARASLTAPHGPEEERDPDEGGPRP